MFDDVTKRIFWSKVDQSAGPDRCWPWTGPVRNGGYGFFSSKYGQYSSHRVSLVLKTGNYQMFAVKLCVAGCPSIARHSCDNPICCNPAHLQWGTPEQNAQDISPDKRAKSVEKAKATIARTGRIGGCRNRQDWLQRVAFNNAFSAIYDADRADGRKTDYAAAREMAQALISTGGM